MVQKRDGRDVEAMLNISIGYSRQVSRSSENTPL